MEINGYCQLFSYQHSSRYLLLCSDEERNSYRFGTSGRWVNDDRIVIFGWTIPLKLPKCTNSIIQQGELWFLNELPLTSVPPGLLHTKHPPAKHPHHSYKHQHGWICVISVKSLHVAMLPVGLLWHKHTLQLLVLFFCECQLKYVMN